MSTPQMNWFAVQVRTNQELRVGNYLGEHGFEQFVPTYQCRKRWSDRVKTVELALFPGYIFCRFDPQDRLPILKAPGVIQIAGYNRVPVPVEENEIRGIHSAVSSGLPNQPWPFLNVGDRVRIEAGPLRGQEGFLIEFKGSYKLILSITLLHRAVAVEIDGAYVSSLQTNSVARLDKTTDKLRPLPITV